MTSATYKLKFPVTIGDKTVSEVAFTRNMKVKDYAAADIVKTGTDKTAAMLASMTGVPIPAFKEMDFEDWLGVQEVAAPFMKSLLDRIMAAAATVEE